MGTLKICAGRRCSDYGSNYLADRAKAEQPDLKVEMCGCLGQCETAPNIVLNNQIHHQVTGPSLAQKLKKI